MAKYRALAKLYVADAPGKLPRLVNTGEYFDSTDVPGSRWEAVDDEAKAAVAARPAPRGRMREARALKPLTSDEAAQGAAEAQARGKRGRRGASKAKGRRGTVAASKSTPTPGKSVAQQHTDGEEPTTSKTS